MVEKCSPKLVIFDMDGVLIDSEPFWKKAEIQAFGEVGIQLTAKDCEQTVGMRIDEVVDFWYVRSPWYNKSKEEVVDHIMVLMCQYIDAEGVALEGVYDSLQLLKKKGIRIALATSSYDILLHAVLKKLAIADFFEYTRSAQVETYGKPHPAVYIHTALKLGVEPNDCLVIEDSYNGMLAGLSAKMKVLVIPEKSHEINPKLHMADFFLSSLTELDRILV